MRRLLVVVLLLALATTARPARADHGPRATSRPIDFTLQLSSSTKNLSFGVSGCWLGYWHANLASDFLLSAILNGFDHDDLDSIRFTMGQTLGARLRLGPFRLEKRCARAEPVAHTHDAPPPPPSRTPALVVGFGAWGISEVDSLTQTFRTGDSGLYLGWSVGVFTSFVFTDITVSFVFRPMEQTAYYLGGEWDSTDFRFNNPTLEIELTYVLPW